MIGKTGIKVSAAPPKWENHWVIKQEPYFTEASGCFQPFMKINEGFAIELMDGADGMPGHAKRLSFSLSSSEVKADSKNEAYP